MKLWTLFLLSASSLLLLAFTEADSSLKQASYRFIHEFARVSSWNPDYITIHKDFFAKYNKTGGGWNFLGTLKRDLSVDLSITVKAFQFRNNEFKRAPINVEMPVCKWLENNITLFSAGHVLEKSNLTRKCPIRAGTYYAYNMSPDATEYPPGVPAGRWLLKLAGIDRENVTIGEVEWIARVEY